MTIRRLALLSLIALAMNRVGSAADAPTLRQLLDQTETLAAKKQWTAAETAAREAVRRFPQSRDLLVILDMRLMTGRSASARALLIQAGVRCVGRVGQAVVLPSQQMGEAYLQVVEAGVALVRLAGLRVEIAHDLPAVLARYRA